MKIDRIHHVAYRCMDANRTVDCYKKYLNMDLVLAMSEDKVPSPGEPDPYIHIFLDAGSDNVLAFFEIPNSPKMGWDENTPDWVQHIAFKVADEETLLKAKEKLEANNIQVVGPTNHHIFQSIDPLFLFILETDLHEAMRHVLRWFYFWPIQSSFQAQLH